MRARLLASLALVATSCAAPVLTKDGQLAFSQGGARGASVITANGIEFMDLTEVPSPIIRRSAYEPWVPPTGFLLPASGVWQRTSAPIPVPAPGVGLIARV